MRRLVLTVVALLPVLATFHACALRKKLNPDNLGKDGGRSVGPGGAERFTEDELKAADDVVGYAQYCKQELGLPPATLAPWNCLDGTEVPTTINGQPLDEANYKQLSAHEVGCDVGSWLGAEPCANYGFVQKRQLSPDVEAYFLCRMRGFSTYKDRAARLSDLKQAATVDNFNALYAFDSLGLIWTNRRTGKTCFFDFVGRIYGGYAASPDDERAPALGDLPDPKPPAEMTTDAVAGDIWKKGARKTWRPPKQVVSDDNCVRCHDTGALKSSPWLQRSFPIASNDPAVPFQVVGKLFENWQQRFPLKAISTAPLTRDDGTQEAQVCTGCHRIGSQESCGAEVAFATGAPLPTKISDLGQTFSYRTWMPPAPAAWHGKTDDEMKSLWTAAYSKHLSRLQCCCKTPGAKNCLAQDFTQNPLPPPVAGTGPDVCP